MSYEYCTVKQAVEMMKASPQFFTVAFTKRTDNETRIMNCRVGVKKGLKGVGKNKTDNSLLTVYETKKGYRTINISGIRYLKIKGKTYIIT